MIREYLTEDYNSLFDTETGMFLRWGKDFKDNPQYCRYGPELLDIEISTICSLGCPYCYKQNTPKGKNMSAKTFRRILVEMPETVRQVALGIGDFDANPDLPKILDICHDFGIVPNITINGFRMGEKEYDTLTKCGAVAVSCTDNVDHLYRVVADLTMRNIPTYVHAVLAEETWEKCRELNELTALVEAIVFLWYKDKNQSVFHPISDEHLETLVKELFEWEVVFGFDSCGAHRMLEVASKLGKGYIEPFVEPCESGLFSYYINVDGIGYPCSFLEGDMEGVEVLKEDFWNHFRTIEFRNLLLDNQRKCPRYGIDK